eukprot:XP_014029113.1 PREDICTED: myosin light chain kinase, smooth muscle-like [Salmo salar]
MHHHSLCSHILRVSTKDRKIKFTCEIAREPAPEIECLKDNIMVSMTSNRKLSCSKNVYTLEIIEATVADSGKYTIKAKNKYGQCSGTSSINITTPKIESLPEDISIEPRKTLSVSCAFSGHPTPEIEWVCSG